MFYYLAKKLIRFCGKFTNSYRLYIQQSGKMPEYSYGRMLGIAFGGGLFLELAYYAARYTYDWFREGHVLRKKASDKDFRETVLFFPDPKPNCVHHFSNKQGCMNRRCQFSHDESYSFGKVIRLINSARRTLDVAVFCITNPELGNILIDLHNKGVIIRVITDDEQIEQSRSQIGAFRKSGIQVRHDRSTYLMHHKFVVIDKKILLNGSFNWTRQAVTGNQENVFISSREGIVKQYLQEYEKLWEQFDPKK